MFSNEHDFDCSITTIMDEEGQLEDVKIFMYEDMIVLEQWIDDIEDSQTLLLTPEMYRELLDSVNYSEGLFKTK